MLGTNKLSVLAIMPVVPSNQLYLGFSKYGAKNPEGPRDSFGAHEVKIFILIPRCELLFHSFTHKCALAYGL